MVSLQQPLFNQIGLQLLYASIRFNVCPLQVLIWFGFWRADLDVYVYKGLIFIMVLLISFLLVTIIVHQLLLSFSSFGLSSWFQRSVCPLLVWFQNCLQLHHMLSSLVLVHQSCLPCGFNLSAMAFGQIANSSILHQVIQQHISMMNRVLWTQDWVWFFQVCNLWFWPLFSGVEFFYLDFWFNGVRWREDWLWDYLWFHVAIGNSGFRSRRVLDNLSFFKPHLWEIFDLEGF